MSLLNSIGKEAHKLLSKNQPKESKAPDPEGEISDAKISPDRLHSELSTMICPDCHKNVKAMMIKHGMMSHPGKDSGEISSEMESDVPSSS